MNELGCDVTGQVSRRDRLLANKINGSDGENSWTPNTIMWLGRDDPRCEDWESIARGENNGALIRKLLELTGSSL